MDTRKIINTLGFFSLIGAIGLLIWWFLMPVFLPVADASNNFQKMILDSDWILLNSIGLISTLFLSIGFPGFYIKHYAVFGKTGFWGAILATAGLILFTCIQYYETIIWPAAAEINPELVQVEGALVSGNSTVLAGLLVSGIILGIGYILFGISALKAKTCRKIPVWFLIIGAPAFGNGILFPIRTLGLILFCTGTIWLSIDLRKN